MIWYLIKFQQYNKLVWVRKILDTPYWQTIRGNYISRESSDIVFGIVFTEDSSTLEGIRYG